MLYFKMFVSPRQYQCKKQPLVAMTFSSGDMAFFRFQKINRGTLIKKSKKTLFGLFLMIDTYLNQFFTLIRMVLFLFQKKSFFMHNLDFKALK